MFKVAVRRGVIAGASALALAAGLLASAPAQAQTLANLRGRVEGAAAGATVTATDTNTGRVSTAVVVADGTYAILGLNPSTYHVTVSGKPAQDVVLPIGQTITADFGTTPSGEVVVTGRRTAATEIRTATITTNVTQTQILNLPQNDRNFLNFAALAPGVTVTPSAGARQISAGAVSSSQTNVYIDGVSFKNPVNHGGVVGQNFSRGNPFPQDAIQEFAVDTQNFKAEYEQAGSAIITSQTKTGGTELHGDIFGEFQPRSFIAQDYFSRNLPKPDYDRKQYGGSIGGAIVPELLHFFVAYEATNQVLPSTAVDLNAGASDRVPAAIANQYNGSYGQSFDQRLFFGKLTLFASPQDQIDANVFIRRENNLSDYGGQSVPSHGHDLLSAVDNYELKWNHRAGPFLNEFTFAYNTADNGTPRVSSGPELVLERQGTANGALAYDNGAGGCGAAVSNIPCVSTGSEDAYLGANSFLQNDSQRIITFQNYSTFSIPHHIIKGGVKVSFTTLSREEDNDSNGSYYFLDSTYQSLAASTPFAARVSTVPVQPASAKDDQIGVFIQDDWTPDDHWTINAGIRWDYETNAKDEDFVTPAAIATALRNYQPWKAAGINAENYISNGHNRSPVADAFQPRLGVSYDVWGDRDLIIFAGAGRYYDRPLFIDSALEKIKDIYQSVPLVTFCNPAGGAYNTLTPCSAHTGNPAYLPYSAALKDPVALRNAVTATGLQGDVWLLNNDTKLPYSDQFDVGVRKRFGPFNAAITYSHVNSFNLFQYVRGNRLPDGNYTDSGNQWIDDTFPVAGQLAGHNGKLDIGSNAGRAHYDAVYLQFDKPIARDFYGFTNTLTISRARTNVAQDLGGDEFYNGPEVNVYGWHYVAGSESFRYVGTAIVRGPWDTTLAGTLTLSSGPYFGDVIFGLPNTPPTACCYGNFGGVFTPKQFFGYKNLDLRIAKTFHTPVGDVTADFQAYNIFDWVNRSYSAWGAGSRSYDATTGTISDPTRKENSTVGNARQFQAGVRYAF